MHRLTLLLIISLSVLVLAGLTACSSGDAPAEAIESYLEALVAKDADAVVNLSCADWETSAAMEVDSLEAVDAALDGVTCATSGTDGELTLVTCTGSIVLTYNGEDRPIELSARTFVTVQQGGEWLMCGYR